MQHPLNARLFNVSCLVYTTEFNKCNLQQLIPELSCREADICHLYASCIEEEGTDRTICVCDEGYQGDGTNCYKSGRSNAVSARNEKF